MKILFINSGKFDYNQDITFAGLTDVLGKACVRDWPINIPYHCPIKKYPKNLGYTNLTNPLDILSSRSITPENCDAVILGSCKPKTFFEYIKIIDRIKASTPVVLIDGGDRAEIGGDLIRLNAESLWIEATKKRKFDVVFKREFLKDKVYAKNIFPYPFGINTKAFAIKRGLGFDKNFCFWAVESHPIRTQALELLKGQFDCDHNGTSKNQTFSSYKLKGLRYLEEMSKAKIVLNLRGGGWDTLRYWEVPALGETLMISQPLDIVIPNDFTNGENIVHCRSDLSDLLDLAHYYLDHEDERMRIARASHQHLLQFHTHVARAEYLKACLLKTTSA